MGNFSHLACRVLNISGGEINPVSCFPSLVKETGNLSPKYGNCDGNLIIKTSPETVISPVFQLETGQETLRKPTLNLHETFSSNRRLKFSKQNGVDGLLDDFFRKAELLGLKLLYDDKDWLKTICVGESLNFLEEQLNQYVEYWIEGMALQKQEHCKQNSGRFKANVFLREAISARSRRRNDGQL